MAIELPYFKFIATEWLTGSIALESLEVQGLFINICALYWKNGGTLSIVEIEKRYRKKSVIANLTERFISVTDGYISIDFLDEQLSKREYVSKKNRENGKKGGQPAHKKNLTEILPNSTEALPNPTNIEKEKNKKENKNKIRVEFIKPTFIELEEYCQLHGYGSIAKKVFEYYDTANWKDSKGSQVKNWKQKLQGVWFRPENLTPENKQKEIVKITKNESKSAEQYF